MTFRKDMPRDGETPFGRYRIKPAERGLPQRLGKDDGPSPELLREVITGITDVSVPGRQPVQKKPDGRPKSRRDTMPGMPMIIIEETKGRSDEKTAPQAVPPVHVESGKKRRKDSTLVMGRRNMEIERMRVLVPEGEGSPALEKWKEIFSNACLVPEHNKPNLDFDVFRENLARTGKLHAMGRAFNLVMTTNHLFIVSKESLEGLQNEHPELTGNADLTRSTQIMVRKEEGDSGGDRWVPLFLINVTDADIDAMMFAGTERGRMAGALAKRNETVETGDSLVPSGRRGLVDVEQFKAKLARCTRDPQSISFFDTAGFARNIVQVMSSKGNYHITVNIEGIDYAYRLYVYPKRPESREEYHNCDTFFYDTEFCALVQEKC